MPKIFRLLIFCCWWSLWVLPVMGQSSGIYGDMFTARSGLSNSKVNTVLQDSLGFLWIGTDDGLNKYDGYTFEHFRYQPDTISLSSNKINCIVEGHDGILWIGTDNGLNKLDRLRGYLWTYILPDSEGRSGTNGIAIHDILVDEEKNVWIRTDTLIEKYNPGSGKFTVYNLPGNVSHQPKDQFPSRMIMDDFGRILIGTPNGLKVFDPGEDNFVTYVDPKSKIQPDWDVRAVISDKDDNIWLGTDRGLYYSKGIEGPFRNASDSMIELKGINVLSLVQTSGGFLVVGMQEGFLIIDTHHNHVEQYRSFIRQELITKVTAVNSIFEDVSEILWLGTPDGLVKIDRKEMKFNAVSSLNPVIEGISSYNIISLLQEENGDLWLGTGGKGLNYLKAGTNRAVVYSINSYGKSINHNYINAIHRDMDGNIWLGTGDGVSFLEAGSQRFKRFCADQTGDKCNLFEGQQVYDIMGDSKGHIWFAASNGVHRFDPEADTIYSINTIFDGLERMEFKDVNCLLEDGQGWIWIGSSIGLIKYSTSTGEFDVYQAGTSEKTSNINSNTIYCLMMDSREQLWIGTASGLNRYDAAKDRFEYFPDPVELSEMRIYSILEDGKRNLWMGTDKGLAFYNTELETFISYGPAEGLQNFEFNPGARFKNSMGLMHFGSVSGFISFHPDSLVYNSHIPPLSFTQFVRIREQGGQSKPIALDRVSIVKIPRGDQIVNIRFSALDFTLPEKNRYMYRMVKKGEDGLWIHNGEQHHVTFYKLTPGTYTLSIKGSNNDLLFNDEEVDLEIVIPYSFWGKGFTFSMYILAAMIILYFGIRIKTRKLRKSNRILREKEVSAKEISLQREELVIKNKNITDSINYAKRIQHALLPTWDNFNSILPDSFVLFKPKDIVSGDFYWINQHGNKVYIAAVDCTGHGVPGAFVSIIGFELFRKITTSEQGSNPAMILDTLNDNFTEIFSDGEQVYLNDGMDLSLCVIDNKEKSLDFAGAFNPLYLVRNETIIEVKADRFSVGADVHATSSRKLFKSHKIYLQPDDVFYLFSDGYADQFGGPEGKKFKYRRFRHLLLTINKLPMDKQESILDESIEEWMGDEEQIDDILVIGIRPSLK
jgi:ligand-binding sensor domain-containing protein/serine phosphatase RsbU (regulator of sigma subunit)